MKDPSPLYGTVGAHYTTRLSSTRSNASLTRPYPREPYPCHTYPSAALLLLLRCRCRRLRRPKNRRGSLGHSTSSSGLYSSQNQLLAPCFEYKSNPRMGFTSFTISPGRLPQFQKFPRLTLMGFLRRSVPW
jgi:hypothetical protein